MLSIQNDTIFVARHSKKLVGFRLEDTERAPVVIVFVDENKPELFPLQRGQTPPTMIKSQNMETEIQVITYKEIHAFMNNSPEEER